MPRQQPTYLDRIRVFQKVGYTPQSSQLQFHRSEARFKVLIAGSRFGKSIAAACEVLPWLEIENSRGWIVGPSYRLAEKEFRYLADYAPKLAGDTGEPRIRRGGAHGPSSITMPTGAEVLTLSSADPSNLLGEELDWLILSEGAWLDSEVWVRFLRARLTSRSGVLVLPTTPAGFNWVHELFLRGQDAGHPDWVSFQFATGENMYVASADIEEARRTLPSHIFDEQYLGRFVRPSGLVYPEFSHELHVCDTSGLAGMEWARGVGGLDFGFCAPFILLIGSLLGNGQLVIRRELRRRRRTLLDLMPLMESEGAKGLEMIWCDPSSPGHIADLRKFGYNARGAENSVAYGIEHVRRRLQVSEAGMPGLLIDRSCTGLIQEFTTYCYEMDDAGPERFEAEAERERIPEKANDHALDALRYMCLALREGMPEVRWRMVK